MIVSHTTLISIEIIILFSGFLALWYYKQKIVGGGSRHYRFYSDYINSKKWEDLRRCALERAHYKCELCNTPYKAVHHVRYPKKYKNDHIDNLLVVCDKCHALVHGIRDNEIIDKIKDLYSSEVKAGSRTYFFQWETSISGNKSLFISESWKRGTGMIEIPEDNLNKFSDNINYVLGYLNNKDNMDKLYNEKLSLNGSTYFFEIKSAVNESKYLTITESIKMDNGSFKKDKIIIFEDGSRPFLIGLDNALNFLKT